jgi:hypothetical protein
MNLKAQEERFTNAIFPNIRKKDYAKEVRESVRYSKCVCLLQSTFFFLFYLQILDFEIKHATPQDLKSYSKADLIQMVSDAVLLKSNEIIDDNLLGKFGTMKNLKKKKVVCECTNEFKKLKNAPTAILQNIEIEGNNYDEVHVFGSFRGIVIISLLNYDNESEYMDDVDECDCIPSPNTSVSFDNHTNDDDRSLKSGLDSYSTFASPQKFKKNINLIEVGRVVLTKDAMERLKIVPPSRITPQEIDEFFDDVTIYKTQDDVIRAWQQWFLSIKYRIRIHRWEELPKLSRKKSNVINTTKELDELNQPGKQKMLQEQKISVTFETPKVPIHLKGFKWDLQAIVPSSSSLTTKTISSKYNQFHSSRSLSSSRQLNSPLSIPLDTKKVHLFFRDT